LSDVPPRPPAGRLTCARRRRRADLARPFGKTSLVLRVLRELEREGVLVAHVDLLRTPSKERFAATSHPPRHIGAELLAGRVLRSVAPGPRGHERILRCNASAINLREL
jgi:hypothetical protein